MAITQNSRVYGNNSGTDVQLKVNADGELAINLEEALPAGTNLMGKVGIDQTTPGTTNGVVINSIVAGDTNIGNVDLASALSSEYDSIDVSKMSKGTVTTAHSAITGTATSAEIDCRGYNSAWVAFLITAGAGTWTLTVTGASASGGTFTTIWEKAGLTASSSFLIPVGANYVKITATEINDGATVTVNITPLNSAGIGNDLAIDTKVTSIVIAESASLSAYFDKRGYSKLSIEMPAAWTTAYLSFAGCSTPAGTYVPVYAEDGIEITMPTSTSRIVTIGINDGALASVPYLKIRSGTVGTPVVQTAARTLNVLLAR